MNKIKVLIVDDSALIRKVMKEILDTDDSIEVIGQSRDPLYAMEAVKKTRPDVIILDIEMPRMDGLTYLKKIMSEDPIPVVICSSVAEAGSANTVDALRSGAIEIITKPQIGVKGFLEEAVNEVVCAVKSASKAKLTKRNLLDNERQKLHTADVVLSQTISKMKGITDKIIAIGASTGGTKALRDTLSKMPAQSPGIVIVQHMPAAFTPSFAKHLNELSEMDVAEAMHGDRLSQGKVLIAPGGKHMLLKRKAKDYFVEIVDAPLVNRHRPSVDVLFRSVAHYAGANAVGCLMTGMGNDGAQGLLEMKQAGSLTYAQNQQTSVVFGMPKEAWKIGAAKSLVALEDIPKVLINACK